MAPVVRITEAELLAELAAAAPGTGPADAKTAGEMADESGISIRQVRVALKRLQGQGRLHVHRVSRPALDGRIATVAAYTIAPLATSAKRKR